MAMPDAAPALAEDGRTTDPLEAVVIGKVTLRLIPFLFLLYVINILDRANIGIARLQMVDELRFLTEGGYAFGASVFYVGYVLFEVPSNLMLARVGARTWIARILVTWGLVTAGMMFVTGPISFIVLRILLGFAEAGFFPGIILYLSQWFPERVRARAISRFMIASVVAVIFGNPISGSILQGMDGVAGFGGWQWLFVLEGMPAVLLGFVTLYYLPDRPADAGWLTSEERDWLECRMAEEDGYRKYAHGDGLGPVLRDPRIWLLVGVYSTVALGDNAFGFYLPKLLSSAFPEWNARRIGFAAAVPGIVAIIAMLISGAHSDRTRERRWHVACAALLAAVGWSLAALMGSSWLFAGALCITLVGMKCMLAPFWALPTGFLSGRAAAGGIALINSVANIGGFIGPNILGQSMEITGRFSPGMAILAGGLVIGAGLVLCLPVPKKQT
jgi:MFS family permease